ncbi:hypothetical protein BSPWISOXPB_1840 [uncultured Gammaproteobacteria bacterium]|nr:hypothetical protein BSPWISOXPB_1840 [uncultured Gammaproteobacteria bacterium]
MDKPRFSGCDCWLDLYVYVGNNPLKYIDPTGHVKKHLNKRHKRNKRLWNKANTRRNFSLDIFKRVGALKSSSRDRALGKTNFKKTHRKIENYDIGHRLIPKS